MPESITTTDPHLAGILHMYRSFQVAFHSLRVLQVYLYARLYGMYTSTPFPSWSLLLVFRVAFDCFWFFGSLLATSSHVTHWTLWYYVVSKLKDKCSSIKVKHCVWAMWSRWPMVLHLVCSMMGIVVGGVEWNGVIHSLFVLDSLTIQYATRVGLARKVYI